MITLEKIGDAIKFTFDDNGHYLQNGTIEVPINSLSMVMDESDMVTFKRSATNDIFVSARYEDFGMTKAELEAFYKENMVGSTSGGGGSITIDPSLDSGSTNAVANSAITEAVMTDDGEIYSSYASKSEYFVSYRQDFGGGDFVYALILPSVGIETYNGVRFFMSDSQVVIVTANLDNGVITSFSTSGVFDTYFTAELTNNAIKIYSNGVDDIKDVIVDGCVELRFYYKLSGGTASDVIENSVYGELQNIKNDVDNLYNSVPTSEGVLYVGDSYIKKQYWNIGRNDLTSGYTEIGLNNGILGYYNKLGVFASGEKIDILSPQTRTKNLYLVSYDVMKPSKKILVHVNVNYTGTSNTFQVYIHKKNDNEKYYVTFTYNKSTNLISIDNPQNLSIDWFYEGIGFLTVETTDEYFERIRSDGYIAGSNNPYDDRALLLDTTLFRNTLTLQEALDAKQNALVSGTNIKTINNESILGSGNINIQGGGSSYSAGTNISISNNAINCTLPISSGSGRDSVVLGNMSDAVEEGAVSYGYHSVAYGYYSFAGGSDSRAYASESHAEGSNIETKNYDEFSVGFYNLSSSASTDYGDSGNTLFSVGNGGDSYSRHNAFEVRQNGDIYISDTNASGEYYGKPMIKLQDALGQGGGGMDDDMERLISTSLVDLNDRKADKTELAKYQKKGDYATKSELDAKANVSEVMTLAKATENEQVTASALNELNVRLTALEEAVAALQALHNNG